MVTLSKTRLTLAKHCTYPQIRLQRHCSYWRPTSSIGWLPPELWSLILFQCASYAKPINEAKFPILSDHDILLTNGERQKQRGQAEPRKARASQTSDTSLPLGGGWHPLLGCEASPPWSWGCSSWGEVKRGGWQVNEIGNTFPVPKIFLTAKSAWEEYYTSLSKSTFLINMMVKLDLVKHISSECILSNWQPWPPLPSHPRTTICKRFVWNNNSN